MIFVISISVLQEKTAYKIEIKKKIAVRSIRFHGDF